MAHGCPFYVLQHDLERVGAPRGLPVQNKNRYRFLPDGGITLFTPRKLFPLYLTGNVNSTVIAEGKPPD